MIRSLKIVILAIAYFAFSIILLSQISSVFAENAIDKAKKKSKILSIDPALSPFYFTTDG